MPILSFSGRCNSNENCVPIKDCAEKLELIAKLKRCGSTCVSPEEERNLKTSICGFRNNAPNVCCAREAPPVEIITKSPQITRNFDPSKHPSFNLLPDPELCGRTPAGDRIVGGTNAELRQWPWMALFTGTSEL